MGQDDVFDEQSTSEGVPSKKARKSRRSSGETSGIVTRLSKVRMRFVTNIADYHSVNLNMVA